MDLEDLFAAGHDDWRKLHEYIGRIVVSTNSAHWCVFEIMGVLLNTDREDTAPIYYSLRADAAQRDLTKAIAVDRLKEPSERGLLHRLNQAIDNLGKRSGERNAFIHTHWVMQSSSEGHRFAAEGIKHPKLDLNDPFGQAERLLSDLDQIITDLLAVCDELELAPSVQRLHRQWGPRHMKRENPDPRQSPKKP